MSNPNIILYTYVGSPWGDKVGTYLKLRGVAFSECLQPMMWPRPDVELLGVRYRRIPFLAIGRDVYFDSRLIFEKMEQLFQHKPLGCSEPAQQAIQSLFEEWTESAFIFPAFATMPLDIPLLNATKSSFKIERSFLTKSNISLLENFLKDGRQWILGSDSVKLADIHAAFVLHYMLQMPGALPEEVFNAKDFPHTSVYLARYATAVKDTMMDQVPSMTGQEAAEVIRQSEYFEQSHAVVPGATGLSEGQRVKVWRTDDLSSGVKHCDGGKLIGLSSQEIVISSTAPEGHELHLNFPRRNFKVIPMSAESQ
ncbi:hypothetical protein B0T11DRAFT_355454 [Plectosphaerella cucumerina]|uniref:Glutathione S-transferase n=1 Tax=Plectosphaerella cucumerina TaxID=40658 RepID=A0A8K0TI67_9PEZI|nr:hypothetical protein B0T11DRAFT_355454 [Plectosphaerella cucumerina]